MAPPLLGAAQRPNGLMRPQAWGYTFAPQGRPKARMAPPLLGAAQRPNWLMSPQAWGSFRETQSGRVVVRRTRARRHRRVLLPAGARRAGALHHRFRHLRARRPARSAPGRPAQLFRAAAETALLAGARQHALLRRYRRPAVDCDLARLGAAVAFARRAVQGVLPYRAVRAGRHHAGRCRRRVAVSLQYALRLAQLRARRTRDRKSTR